MRNLVLIAAVLAIPALASATEVWYDSFGFEAGVDPTGATADFTLGALSGQGSWQQATGAWTGTADGDGVEPMVVTPDPAGMANQCIELAVGDIHGDGSTMEIGINDPLAADWQIITVSFDIYRVNPAGPKHNLWWWWWDAGTPTYGLQWDLSAATHPFGWNPGAGQAPTVFGAWANLTQEWNFADNTTSSWYDGAPVDVAIPMPDPPDITTLTGWTIFLGHDSDSGNGTDICWIDNFVITVSNPPTGAGDVDGNGVVDGLDLTAVLTAWETQPGDPLWNPSADLDANDVVNGLDLTEVISNWTVASAVPEPGALFLVGLGLLALLGRRK